MNSRELQLDLKRRGDSSPAQRYRFPQGFAVVGSHAECQLRLDDPAVPSRSLYVQQLSDRVVVVPLANVKHAGSAQSGRMIDWPAGRPIKLGPFLLTRPEIETAGDEHAAAENVPSPMFAEPAAAWEIANVKGDESACRVRHVRHPVTLIGRGSMCRFRMIHESIAEVHASLVVLPEGLQVIDLCGTEGIYVNGRRVLHTSLHDGDSLRVGECHGVIRLLRVSECQPIAPTDSVPPPLEPRAANSVENFSRDGIVVSLSESGLEVREVPLDPGGSLAGNPAAWSKDECLKLIAQLLEMQQSMMEQTQMLMQKISERLQSEELAPDASKVADEAYEKNPSEIRRPPPQVSKLVVSDGNSSPGPARQHATEESETTSAPAPEFHVWLNHRLADLETTQRTGFSRLWQRLTGIK